jgi:hypothetical protein
MPVETRAQLADRYRAVFEAVPQGAELAEEDRGLDVDESGAEGTQWQVGWSKEQESGKMASGMGAEGRLRFSGRKGDGLTIEQLELMVKGSLVDRFKKLQKDVGNPVEGAEFNGRFCIYLGEFLDNPARLAHEREYEAHCRKANPVESLLASLRRHFAGRGKLRSGCSSGVNLGRSSPRSFPGCRGWRQIWKSQTGTKSWSRSLSPAWTDAWRSKPALKPWQRPRRWGGPTPLMKHTRRRCGRRLSTRG